MSSQLSEVYAEHAYALAERWADRNRADGDPEYRIVAAVIHDLLKQRNELRELLGRAEALQRNLHTVDARLAETGLGVE